MTVVVVLGLALRGGVPPRFERCFFTCMGAKVLCTLGYVGNSSSVDSDR